MVAYFSSEASCAVEPLSLELRDCTCEAAGATADLASDAAAADVASGVLAGAEPCRGCGPLSEATEAAKLQSDALLSEAREAAVATADLASGEPLSDELVSERSVVVASPGVVPSGMCKERSPGDASATVSSSRVSLVRRTV